MFNRILKVSARRRGMGGERWEEGMVQAEGRGCDENP